MKSYTRWQCYFSIGTAISLLWADTFLETALDAVDMEGWQELIML